MSLSELNIDIPAEHEKNVFGQFDVFAKKIERTFHVTLISRDGIIIVYLASLQNYPAEEIQSQNKM